MGLEAPCTSRPILWRPACPRKNGAGNHPSLYWVPRSQCPMGEGIVAFSTDDKPQFFYEPFNQGRDFGPLDIARTVMYCRWVEALCNAHVGCSALVHVVSDTNGRERANTVALCGAFLIFCSGASAEEAYRPFAAEPLPRFCDCRGEANPGAEIAEDDEADFQLDMLDVLRGLEKARDLNWVDYRTFDVEEHSSSLRPERGDMSWLIPGRALALASPWAEPHDQDGLPVCTPALLCPYFLRHGVLMVVQCNNPEREEEGPRRRLLSYEAQSFKDVGVEHLFIPFEDGGCPSIELILQFLAEVEARAGAFAVHCRSGLGRTATLIGVYAIRHLGFTARGFIGWARSMRPGTVHGSQQQYLVNMEPFLKPGAARTLCDLNERERLMLLPRRELRFWALDSGIAPSYTKHASELDIVELILSARGIYIPRAVAPEPVAVAPPARALAPVLRTQAQVQGTGQLLPKPSGPKPTPAALQPGQLPLPGPAFSKSPPREAANAKSETAGEAPLRTAASPQGPQAQLPTKAAASGSSEVADRLSSLNAAIASLGRSLHTSADANGDKQSDKQSDKQTPLPGGASTPVSAQKPSKVAAADEWAEVLRYLHLHAAMQEGTDAWENVRQTVELLRAESLQTRPPTAAQPPSPDDCGELTRQIATISEAHQAAQKRSADCEQELRRLQQEAQSMQRESKQLRAKLLRDQEAQLLAQAKMEERGEALVAGLQSDEQRLEVAVREVEELRAQVLKRGGLEQQQVDHVEQLRREIAEARAVTLHHSVRSRELRMRLEAANSVTGNGRSIVATAIAAS